MNKKYIEHKDEIIADLVGIGRAATREKWNIPKGGSIHGIVARWLTPEQKAVMLSFAPKSNRSPRVSDVPTTPPIQSQPDSPGVLVIPQFPEFSETWATEIQLAWLEVYARLLNRLDAPPHTTQSMMRSDAE